MAKLFTFILITFQINFIYSQNYIKGHLIAKILPQYRNIFESKTLEQIEILKDKGITTITKKFPKHKPLEIKYSVFGDKLVDLSLIYELKCDSSKDLIYLSHKLRQLNLFEYIEPENQQELFYTANDPEIPLGSMWWINKMQAFAAWDITQGNPLVTIGITDTGFDLDHPDMVNAIQYNLADPIDGVDNDGDGYLDNYQGWDFIGAISSAPVGDNNPSVMPTGNAHGVNVAGLAAARTDNAIGISSPGFNCKYLPIKIMSDNGGGLNFAYDAIVYAADHGCDIINCSWGSSTYSQFNQDVINYATFNKNSLVVAACGNSNADMKIYPAAYENVISVTTTMSDDGFGFPTLNNTYNYTVDVAAPGRNVKVTMYNDFYGQAFANYTSFASPMAASTAALIKSAFPTYSALQVGERLRVTTDNIYPLNPSPTIYGKIGTGRINMFKAVSVVTPAIRLNSPILTDGNDNFPSNGETITFSGNYKNFLDPSNLLQVTISSTDPNITILSGTVNLGTINTLAQVNTAGSPFTFSIGPSAPSDYTAYIRIDYTDASGYTDFEYIPVLINLSYRNIDINSTKTTANSRGNFGFNDYANNNQGLGLNYNNQGNWLFEGGFLIGKSSTEVSDVIRDPASQAIDFAPITYFNTTSPGIISDMDGTNKFIDVHASKLDIETELKTYAWNTAGDQKFVIFEYTLTNKSLVTHSNVHAGMFADWDIGSNYATNVADFDSLTNTSFCRNSSSTQYTGFSLLTWDSLHTYGVSNPGFFSFTTTNKFFALTQGSTYAKTTPFGADVMHFISSGPFTIAPNESQTIAFAMLAGDNLTDVQATSDAANIRYRCTVLANRPHLDFASGSVNFTESSTSGTINCRGYRDYTINLNIDKAPSLNTDVYFFQDKYFKSNCDAYDYEIVNPIVTFPTGSTASQQLIIRVFDDNSFELNESFKLKFKILTNSDLIPGCSFDEIVISISDNDSYPVSGGIESNLFSTDVYFGPQDTVLITNPGNGNNLGILVNLTNYDYGCTTVEIDRAGLGAIPFENPYTSGYAMEKTFKITPTFNDPTGIYKASLYFTDAELTGWETITGNSRNDLNLFKTDGNVSNVTPANILANGPNNVWGNVPILTTFNTNDLILSSTFITGFSGFGAGKNADGGPLPIEIQLFAKLNSDKINVYWEQKNINGILYLEKSLDGNIWFQIANQLVINTFEDKNVSLGKNIYRLKLVDFNGNVDYSNIAEVYYNSDFAFQFYPNPTQKTIYFNYNCNENKVLEIIDVNGKVLMEFNLEMSNKNHELNVSNLAEGIYFFKEKGNQKYLGKFIKKAN